MVVLVIGTPDSGKSERAEKIALELSDRGKKYYIATMIPYGDEGLLRVEKHKKARAGKGFVTIEKPSDVHELALELSDIKDSTCLLECMSNLIGNEMHREAAPGADVKYRSREDILADKITESVKALIEAAANLVIVTNRFPSDDEGYDDETREYVRLVTNVNSRLKKEADRILELTEGEWKFSEHH